MFAIKSIQQALTRNNAPSNAIQKERLSLDDELTKVGESDIKSSMLFPSAVSFVNKNLMSHGHHGLPEEKSAQYKSLVNGVAEGDISNTSAFAASSFGWSQQYFKAKQPQERADALVGAVMNAGGAFFAGAADHQDYKLGKK
ncbi:hypothetical protein [Shewanella sp. YLB-07]|uniref:hypothetical protein n=1 Tax=Shewanella sp. YLB-07 TaxID=2601268 RepID=UPI00128D9350|nr:hypothetical protein [Shewanella sp. YLB-07]MPY24369.1 hypothetical protein [Shewanella sp. YLB-07]